MTRFGRRAFVKSGAALAAAGGLPFVYSRRSFAASRPPLVPDPNLLLDLAEGFSYRILDRTSDPMSDGFKVPGLPDGMGCFDLGDGKLALMRNHELSGLTNIGPYPAEQPAPLEAYDPATHGGVTRLVVDASTFEPVSSNLVLVGTTRNCAGGWSPWGWLTCEEAVDATHGYVFVCSPHAERVAPPVKLPWYGHMYHEAAVVDPRSYAGYVTEDRPDGCFYRFLPDDPKTPFIGRFQALGIAGQPLFDTTTGLTSGQALDVSWVDLPNPDPRDDSLRWTAKDLGAAIVCRGEGIWYQGGIIYFTATSGGNAGKGQIFALEPSREGGNLVVVADSTGVDMLDGPDSITVAPWGDVLVTEDSVSGLGQSRLLGITPEGEMYVIARTLLGELSSLCFSPDGRAMFLSIFHQGVTVVVTGPFPDPIERIPDPTEPDPSWGSAGAGGAPDVPHVTEPPAPVRPRAPAARIRPVRGCGLGAPEAPTGEGALAIAVALGTAALAAGRGAGDK
jgi:secreted PhoX family phosphatase